MYRLREQEIQTTDFAIEFETMQKELIEFWDFATAETKILFVALFFRFRRRMASFPETAKNRLLRREQ